MDALDSLTTRSSPKLLAEPGPDDAALAKILSAACAAPDHGRLKPWRFLVIRGQARERLGEVLADALKRREPGIAPEAVERDRVKPLRSPLIVVVTARAVDSPKIPKVEQIISAGIAGQNILLAAHALGFAGKWSTGPAAYDPEVKRGLGLSPEDSIIGFIYLGTAAGDPPITRRPDYTAVTQEWTEPASIPA
jgi:nitroreductase